MIACEAFDLELAIQRLFVGGSAVVWSSSLRWWTEFCAGFEIVVVFVVVVGVMIPWRALAFNFLPIMGIFGRVEGKETTG
jgi:hypothetical protein